MIVQRDTLLCRYHYDPLDRVASFVPLNEPGIQRYYRKDRLATELQGRVRYSVFEHEAQLLAQQRHEAGGFDSSLLATDLQRSVLHSVAAGQRHQSVYSSYGYRSPEGGLSSLLAFNGERRDPLTGHYLLGNGYRAFNPVLMRFNSPDGLSPFGRGGVNAYAYCQGDPINRVDPTGRYFAPALVTGLSGGALLQRAVNTTVAAVIKVGRGVQGGLNAVNKLRPSYRAAELTRARNAERLVAIEDFNKIRANLTDTPPFATTRNHALDQKAKVENFVGPRYVEGGPAKDFEQLLDNSALADADLKRVITEDKALRQARTKMDDAVRKWREATGFGVEDLKRIDRLAGAVRKKS